MGYIHTHTHTQKSLLYKINVQWCWEYIYYCMCARACGYETLPRLIFWKGNNAVPFLLHVCKYVCVLCAHIILSHSNNNRIHRNVLWVWLSIRCQEYLQIHWHDMCFELVVIIYSYSTYFDMQKCRSANYSPECEHCDQTYTVFVVFGDTLPDIENMVRVVFASSQLQ